MADKILRRTSYGGEQTDSLDPASMQTVRQKKTASSSEPKLFKTNVFSRQKAMRHTFRFSKQDSVTSGENARQVSGGGGTGGGDGSSEMSERSKLQRHKAQSRKTFKFRKTRKEMRKSKTTNEPGEPVDPALELQPTGGDLARGNTIILNPALHSAAANLTGAPSSASADGRSGATSVLFRKRTASKKPPALVLTKDGGGGQSSSTLPPGSGNGQVLPHGSSSIGYGYSGGNCGSQSTSPGWKVTFPDIEIHSPKDIQPDKGSISSRGTSSTVGYRDSFGDPDEDGDGVLSLQEPPTRAPVGGAVSPRPSSSNSDWPHDPTAPRPPSISSGTLVATPSSSSNSSVVLQTARDNYSSTQARRRNYIIFEQNDEDTLI